MEEHVKRVLANVEHVKADVVERMDEVIHAAEEIVDEGAKVTHHDVPGGSKLLPYPIGHCPLSVQPLYPPPSIKRGERMKLREVGKEVLRCFQKSAEKVSSRSIRDMEDFTCDKDDLR